MAAEVIPLEGIRQSKKIKLLTEANPALAELISHILENQAISNPQQVANCLLHIAGNLNLPFHEKETFAHILRTNPDYREEIKRFAEQHSAQAALSMATEIMVNISDANDRAMARKYLGYLLSLANN